MKSVSDFPVDAGEPLDAVEGETVVVAAIEPYTLTWDEEEIPALRIVLDSGRVLRTTSPVVIDRLRRIPTGEYPVRATFRRETSRKNPRWRYWTVE